MQGRLAWGLLLVLCAFVIWSPPTCGAVPELRLEKIIGDARGKGIDIVDVAVSDAGAIYLLMRNGRVAVFDRDGAYQQSIKAPVDTSWTAYLSLRGGRLLLGDYRTDFPWVFDDRRQGDAPGHFQNAGTVVADDDRIYVSDRGNNRIQVFDRKNIDTPASVLALEARPGPLAVHGDQLVVADHQRNLFIYAMRAGDFTRTASFRIQDGATALAMAPDGQSIYVAYRHGRNHSLRAYARVEEQWAEKRVIASSLYDLWPAVYLNRTPLVTGPDNQVWCATDTNGSIIALNPDTDNVTERLKGLFRPLALGFDPAGNLYVGGVPRPGDKGPTIQRYTQDGQSLGVFGPPVLYDGDIPIWALLPDRDGGVYVRVVEAGYQKGWPAFTVKKVYSDGTVNNYLDLGSLYAVRTKFHPSSSIGTLVFDREHHIILAAAPHVSVQTLDQAGKTLWEASQYPTHADKVPFAAVSGAAVDARGNIWAADPVRNVLVCLSSDGALLLTYGGFAGVDDVAGTGFDQPTGIAIVITGDREYLVVGDAGNQRLLKYRLTYRD